MWQKVFDELNERGVFGCVVLVEGLTKK